jgi:hypothetical protein
MCRMHGTTLHVYAFTINSVHNSYSTKYPKHALYRAKELAFHNSKNFIYSHILICKKVFDSLHTKLLTTFQLQKNKSCPFSLLKFSRILV